MNKSITIIISSLILTGCATTNESILTGAVVGGATGTTLGHQQGGDSQARIAGAIIGTTVGGLIGYLAHKKKPKKKPATPNKKTDAVKSPFLTRPKVRMYWEPDQIKGNKYIEKHKVWVLESSPMWTKGK